MRKFHTFILVFVFLFQGVLFSQNRYVSVDGSGNGLSWSSPMGSIQSAIWDCSLGDTVFVSSGTYFETVAITDGVSVMGGYHPETGARDIDAYVTTLDGTGLGSFLVVKYDGPC